MKSMVLKGISESLSFRLPDFVPKSYGEERLVKRFFQSVVLIQEVSS